MTGEPAGDLKVSETLTVPGWELSEQFVRAAGPGGQNVNKVATAVQLRWNVDRSSLPACVKDRFRNIWRTRLTREGDVIVEAREHRSQPRNRASARARLASMIARAAKPPRRRKPTRPTAGSVRRRLQSKKQRGEIKSLRGRIENDD